MRKEKKGQMRINNNALFVLALLLIAINSYTFMVTSKDFITAKASAVGTTYVCISAPIAITQPTPTVSQIISGEYNSTLTGSNASQVNFEYFYLGIAEIPFGTDYDSDGDGIFNATLNTTALSDGNCNYRITARGLGLCGNTEAKISAVFTINNIDVPPTWSKFNNSMSTNFSNYSSWTDIPNARIAIPEFGSIGFTTSNLDNADLDYMFNISYNNLTLNTSWDIHNCFNDVEYVLTFFNVTQFAEPIALRGGQPCGASCHNFQYDGENYSFYTRVANEHTYFSIGEGGNLSINWTLINKTFDNSPTINFSTYMHGSIQNIPIAAECYYKTDYSPTEYANVTHTGTINQSVQLPEQNWSYLPTNMGHYAEIQHYNYYSGLHRIYLNCSAIYGATVDYTRSVIDNTTFLLTYTQRDRVYYSDGDEIKLYLRLEEPGLTINANLSQMDSNFNPSNVVVVNNGLDYNISYNITPTNTRADGEYNATIEAFNSSGSETMNGSIFVYLHNNWAKSDIDNAFDCWTFRQGYYFDEVACDWESDLNHVADHVDAFTIETSCFDTIDNDLDGKTDLNDTDCAGIYYIIRREVGIDSAFLGDPCFNNVCRVCLGDSDTNDDGICDTSVGVNVRYLHKVRPGQVLRAKFNKASINNQSVRVSVNYLNDSFDVRDNTSTVEQLPRKELGGCVGGANCKSVTGTTFGPGLPDRFTGALNERLNITISTGSYLGPHPYLAAGKSIGGSSAFQNMIFFEVMSNAIINESDNATYCFDGEDNDLNDYYDCFDLSCNLTSNPSNLDRCEVPQEITCNDTFDNDRDGYADCRDNDCFGKNGTNGPCPAIENFNSTSCADSFNNDYDWGYRCDPNTNISYQTRQTNSSYSGTIQLTDCIDIDCDGSIGNVLLGARCEYCNEHTCNDNFDNDVDNYYDCTGNAYRSNYERDCDRWHDLTITCPTIEINCSDNLDNDLDSDSQHGENTWLGLPVFGGWNCQDLDCNNQIGNGATGARCQYGNETICDDNFDNDGDGLTDCADPTSCKGTSGSAFNFIGLCRPCAAMENISIDACRDGDDNDYDGAIDCSDINCSGKPGPGTTTCGLTETNCTDGIDNDYDGLTDYNDSDCVSYTVYPDELGPGQCNDGIDNDLGGGTDCADSDCANTMRCILGSYNNPCQPIGYVGAIQVGRVRYVNAGKNFTACYTRNPLNVASVVLKLGNVDNSLRIISPIIDDNTSFMTGSLTNFVKVNDTYGLKAQNTDGFSGNLNVNLTSTTGAGVMPGTYTLFVSTSIPGVYGSTTTTTYIAENEPPTINNISIGIGNIMTGPDEVNVVFTANATDNGTYNSGIAFCMMTLSGFFSVNSSTCSYSRNLTSGTYNISVIAYDGALNPSTLYWQNFTFTATTIPVPAGGFYNPYPAENYPDKKFFNDSEKLNIGFNFEGGSGFEANETGCIVEIRNQTDVLLIDHVNLSVVAGEAHCNGQVNLSSLFNKSNVSLYPSNVFYFTVSAYDNSSNKGTSALQDFNFCYYYYDNSSGKYRCRDICQLQEILNRPPVLIEDIPNQTWPRGTKLSVIDLDDYFMDPDNDPLTYNCSVDNVRINVSIDNNNLITLTPDQTFYGFAHMICYASDLAASTPSNTVLLEVLFTPLPQQPPIPAGGGGGGGGGTNATVQIPVCEEDWTCADWGPCLPSGYQTRTCRDRNECGTNNNMPNTTRECTYTPTCRDKLNNGAETGIDCGGPCPPCPTCRDGILNQKEEKISQIMSADTKDRSDCGGPLCPPCPTCQDNTRNGGEEGIDCGGNCRPCATCEDRILNQGELNIDCGGPCQSCKVRIVAFAFNWNLLLLIISSLFLLFLLLLALLFGVFKNKFIRLKAKLLNYHMRLMRMFEKKKITEKELPILEWLNTHLDSIEQSLPSKSSEQAVNSIDHLVRIFFKRILLIRYAFTNEELMQELDKHRVPAVLKKAIEILFEEIGQIKYGAETIDAEGAKTLADQVRTITERIVTEIETKKKTKINISERDIDKISETLSGADELSVEEAVKKRKK
jgi:hypothetical protein